MQKIPFKPALQHEEMHNLLRVLRSTEVSNNGLYSLVREIVSLAEPSREEEYDTYWEDFYLPLRREGKRITVPLCISEYQKKFFIHSQKFGNMKVEEGNDDVDVEYITLFLDVLKLIPYLRETDNELVNKTTPYDHRTGKVLGRHVLRKVMSQRMKKQILKEYEQHEQKDLKVKEISLDDYLETAATSYKAAYPEECEPLTSLELYKRLADGRHGGMLDIKDTASKKEFKEWYESRAWQGCHPFEIVYSPFGYGIHLFPPSEHEPKYSLRVTAQVCTDRFVAMARALIKHEAPFEASGLRGTLDLLAGDSYLSVNLGGFENFSYYPSTEDKKKYFHHIEWDKLNLLQWKEEK